MKYIVKCDFFLPHDTDEYIVHKSRFVGLPTWALSGCDDDDDLVVVILVTNYSDKMNTFL
jgi:hypothetical protein